MLKVVRLLVLPCLLTPRRSQIYHPPSGFINNCDGGRSHNFCGYRQQ